MAVAQLIVGQIKPTRDGKFHVIAVAALLLLAASGYTLMRILIGMVVGLKLTRIMTRVDLVRHDSEEVVLSSTKYTRQPGVYGARWGGGTSHARIGELTHRERTEKQVSRSLERVTGRQLRSGDLVDWSGQYFDGPDDLGLAYDDVELASEGGPAPAWHFAAIDPASCEWIIHVHGIRVTRLSPLRGVAVVAESGAHSLVITYRGDPDGLGQVGSRSTLGLTEWRDIDPAIEYALARGAKRIVLVGWSTGGQMALLASERSELRSHIDELILIGPVTDWRATILHGAREAHVPLAIASLVLRVLSSSAGGKMFGLRQQIDFDSLDWTKLEDRVPKPCLVLHSAGDDEVPFALTRKFAAANKLVTVVELPAALHTLEWNRDPDAFKRAILARLAERWISQSGDPDGQ
jgi:predicted alpha/beta hydrolase